MKKLNQIPRKKIAGLLTLAMVATAVLWFILSRGEAYTDNAYIQGNISPISPKIAGYVVEMPIQDNSVVRAGDILFKIDDRDYQARLAQFEASVLSAKAALANAEASIALQEATIVQAAAQEKTAKALASQTEREFARQKRLKSQNATTDQSYEVAESAAAQSRANLEGAAANLEVQRKKLDVAKAQQQAAAAVLVQAQAARDLASLDLEHTVVRAPVDGVVGNRKVRVGRYVTPGTSLLDLVPEYVWIVANFKETELKNLRPGQKARITVDGIPGVTFSGKVDSIAPGTGSAFSLMPPDNATGNFVRVVQRVPVTIFITEQPAGVNLVPGLSARVTILAD